MTNTPIIILVGPAGSGKDTAAGFMVQNHGAAIVAHADPMKRLAKLVFDFTEDQLWGPSASRNAVDPRYEDRKAWLDADDALRTPEVRKWLRELFGDQLDDQRLRARYGLRNWLEKLRDITPDSGRSLTPRLVLQTLGTEWGRRQGRDIWTGYAVSLATDLLAGGYRYDRAVGLIEDPSAVGPERVVITDGRFRNEVLTVKYQGGLAVKIADASTQALKAGVPGHQSEAEQKTIPDSWFDFIIANNKANGLADLEARVAKLFRILDTRSAVVI